MLQLRHPGVGLYLLAGFFVSAVFRHTIDELYTELRDASRLAVRAPLGSESSLVDLYPGICFARYLGDTRVDGDPRTPERWPQWLAEEVEMARQLGDNDEVPLLVTMDDGTLTLAAASRVGEIGILAVLDRDLHKTIAERSEIWPRLTGSGDSVGATISIGRNRWFLMPLRRTEIAGDIDAFYADRGVDAGFFVRGLDSLGSSYRLTDGEASGNVSATLFAPPATVFRHLFVSSSEVDTVAWIAFVLPAFLLLDLYVAAAVVAGVSIYGLSRAVNQLSSATEEIQSGNFSTRIAVRRRDQIGQLHGSFNEMAASLENLVASAASQELLHKELEIARELQLSLLPAALTQTEGVEIATFFEPSAAIGGDYFDVLRLRDQEHRLIVVVADVAGHGIAAGLRMAMLKAALDTLVQERKEPERILEALDRLVRTSRAESKFVTATLAVIDLKRGTLELTNAGHPPTYLVRAGVVEEIALPGTPLGVLGKDYGRRQLDLERGDVLVWISDGLIEACNEDDDYFGYRRVTEALTGPSDSAAVVRDRLLAAVHAHTRAREIDDDRTLVVLAYRGLATADTLGRAELMR